MLFDFAQKQSDIHLEASLDKNEYDEAELITIKVPVSVAYQNDQANFERVNGELKVNGKIYKYVKRRMSEGQLILMCLPDHKKMQLQSAKDDFFKYSNDLVQNNNSKKSDHSKAGAFKNLLSEYDNYISEFSTAYSIVRNVYSASQQLDYLPSSPHISPEQPPEL